MVAVSDSSGVIEIDGDLLILGENDAETDELALSDEVVVGPLIKVILPTTPL
jgi:hypothetical protein